eukprot:6634464-Pyramimonas_sp.AAC.1
MRTTAQPALAVNGFPWSKPDPSIQSRGPRRPEGGRRCQSLEPAMDRGGPFSPRVGAKGPSVQQILPRSTYSSSNDISQVKISTEEVEAWALVEPVLG